MTDDDQQLEPGEPSNDGPSRFIPPEGGAFSSVRSKVANVCEESIATLVTPPTMTRMSVATMSVWVICSDVLNQVVAEIKTPL